MDIACPKRNAKGTRITPQAILSTSTLLVFFPLPILNPLRLSRGLLNKSFIIINLLYTHNYWCTKSTQSLLIYLVPALGFQTQWLHKLSRDAVYFTLCNTRTTLEKHSCTVNNNPRASHEARRPRYVFQADNL